MKWTYATLAVVAFLTAVTSSPSEPKTGHFLFSAANGRVADSALIVAGERELAAAFGKQDTAKIAKLVAEDFIGMVNPDGDRYGKTELLASLVDPRIHYESWNVDSLAVRVRSPIAIVIGYDVSTGRNSRGPFVDRVRFMETWVLRGGRWQDMAGHYAVLPQK